MPRPHKDKKHRQSLPHRPMAKNHSVVPADAKSTSRKAKVSPKKHSKTFTPAVQEQESKDGSSSPETYEIGFRTFVCNLMRKQGIFEKVAFYCADNWCPSTMNAYKYRLRSWFQFNEHDNSDVYVIDSHKVKNFLIYLFETQGRPITYIRSAYIVARALLHAAGQPFTQADHRHIQMMLNSMFTKRPTQVKAQKDRVWDVSVLLDYFTRDRINRDLSLRDLGGKHACLILLATMRHSIDLTQLDLAHLSWFPNKSGCIFYLPHPTKTYT